MVEYSYLALNVFVHVMIQDERTQPTQEMAGKGNVTCSVLRPRTSVLCALPALPASVSQRPVVDNLR